VSDVRTDLFRFRGPNAAMPLVDKQGKLARVMRRRQAADLAEDAAQSPISQA
jgi:hypothetical protein